MSEFVRADQVAEVIREYLGVERVTRNNFATNCEVSPYWRLASESGVLPRRLYSILKGEQRYVSLSVADAILTAIDRNYLLSNGTIEVVQGWR